MGYHPMVKLTGRARRRVRVRKKVFGSPERPRLTVFRSAKHVYAQVVNDADGRTLASASSVSKELRGASGDKTARAKEVGKALAEACKAAQITAVSFDRNGYRYHGRVKAVAEGAREAGLQF